MNRSKHGEEKGKERKRNMETKKSKKRRETVQDAPTSVEKKELDLRESK